MNEDRELYVDLQIPDGVEPDYDFEVGVTTGRILQEDWRPQNWLIINRKTTSWDYTRLITAADWKFYVDLGDWVWRLLWGGGWGGLLDCNTRTFWISNDQDFTNAQAAYDWYMSWKNAILMHEWEWGMEMFYLAADWTSWSTHNLDFEWAEEVFVGNTNTRVKAPTIQLQAAWWTVNNIFFQYWREFGFIDPNATYVSPFIATQDYHPATKKYVDDGLALKQDKIIAGNNITINADWKTINATIPQALVYKWSVTWLNDLPSSWQTVWDTYFVEWEDAMYSWDWTQWSYVWGTGIDVTNLFNKTIDDSDDITEGSIHLFCTTAEKNYWNSKQDALTAWANIQISNNVISATDTVYYEWDWIDISNANVISNTAKFEPENAGSLGQFLKKTSTGYTWANIPWWWSWTTYTAWDGINISSNNVISATDRFTPTNTGSTGQVLKKSGANSYYWANEWWGGWGWNFNPQNDGTVGQVLTKTATGYDWETLSGWVGNVKAFLLDLDNYTSEELWDILEWVSTWTDYCAIVKLAQWDVCVYSHMTTSWTTREYHFFSPKYNVETTNSTNGDFTTLYNTELIITSNNWVRTAQKHDFNNYANFLKVEDSGYTTPYMPTQAYQPATKGYVDSRNWVGTQAQYDQLTPEQWVIYNIIPSS